MRTKHLGPDASALDDRQPSAAIPALEPQRGRSQGREAPRKNDEGSLYAQAERRLPRDELSPATVAHHEDLGPRSDRMAESPQVVKVSGTHQSEFPEPTTHSDREGYPPTTAALTSSATTRSAPPRPPLRPRAPRARRPPGPREMSRSAAHARAMGTARGGSTRGVDASRGLEHGRPRDPLPRALGDSSPPRVVLVGDVGDAADVQHSRSWSGVNAVVGSARPLGASFSTTFQTQINRPNISPKTAVLAAAVSSAL
jgi:hypothetical protein